MLSSLLGLFTLIALLVAIYPFRKKKGLMILLTPLLLALVYLAYDYWGGMPSWHGFKIKTNVQHLLDSKAGTRALIEQMKARIAETPTRAEGWYLIGKLYLREQDYKQANESFARAHQLQPESLPITLTYAQSVWDLNQQAFDDETRTMLKQVLKENPKQPDALAMLALDAFKRHRYNQAIHYWQRLLPLVRPQSEEANALQEAIAKAKSLQ